MALSRFPSRPWNPTFILASLLVVPFVASSARAAPGTSAVVAPPVAAPATANQRLVAVVRSPDADGASQEIATRIVAELMADGIPVVVLTCSSVDPVCMAVSGTPVSAIVLVQRQNNNVSAVEVRAGGAVAKERGAWSPAVLDGGRVQRVADGEAGGSPAALAIRTVELLRAMLIEVSEQQADAPTGPAGHQTSETPAAVVHQTVDTGTRGLLPIGPRNLTLSMGLAVFGGLQGLSTSYGPTLSLGRRTSDHVLLSAVLAGPSFGRDQKGVSGTVSVRHELAMLQADLLGLFLNRFVLRAGFGAGVYHVHIQGQSNGGDFDPFTGQPLHPGRSDGAFAGLLAWSAGAAVNLWPDVGLFVDGRLFVLTPTPVVLLDTFEVGRVGNPGVVVTSGLELRF
jgi:hypothetical protein